MSRNELFRDSRVTTYLETLDIDVQQSVARCGWGDERPRETKVPKRVMGPFGPLVRVMFRHVLCSFSKHMKTIVEKDKHKHGESELRGLCVAANSLGSFRGLVIASFYEPR